MTATQHTPGPWKAGPFPFDVWQQKQRDGKVICIMKFNRNDDEDRSQLRPTQEEAEANARLIAAAPDTLEALKKCFEYFDDRYDGAPDSYCQAMVEPMEAARAAILKATGKE